MDRNDKPVRTRFPPSVKVTVGFLEPNELDELRKCSGRWGLGLRGRNRALAPHRLGR